MKKKNDQKWIVINFAKLFRITIGMCSRRNAPQFCTLIKSEMSEAINMPFKFTSLFRKMSCYGQKVELIYFDFYQFSFGSDTLTSNDPRAQYMVSSYMLTESNEMPMKGKMFSFRISNSCVSFARGKQKHCAKLNLV